jgi:hypothetical protein
MYVLLLWWNGLLICHVRNAASAYIPGEMVIGVITYGYSDGARFIIEGSFFVKVLLLALSH